VTLAGLAITSGPAGAVNLGHEEDVTFVRSDDSSFTCHVSSRNEWSDDRDSAFATTRFSGASCDQRNLIVYIRVDYRLPDGSPASAEVASDGGDATGTWQPVAGAFRSHHEVTNRDCPRGSQPPRSCVYEVDLAQPK
jgi:hypothetical protein